MSSGGGILGGGRSCEMVRADTEDLSQFVDQGNAHVARLRGIFNSVDNHRARVFRQIGGAEAPAATVARGGGGADPFAELIAEVTITNAFVGAVRDGLETPSATGSVRLVPVTAIDAALSAAGLGDLGADASQIADQQLVAKLKARSEIEAVVAETLGQDPPDHLKAQMIGLALEEWLASSAAGNTLRSQAVAEALIDAGLARQAAAGGIVREGSDSSLALVFTTAGVGRLPAGERAALVDRLAAQSMVTPAGESQSALALLVSSLDLDEEVVEFLGAAPNDEIDWRHEYRFDARLGLLGDLIEAGIGQDSTASVGSQTLTELVLDHHPAVIEADDSLAPADLNRGLRTLFANVLTAPNYGMRPDQYEGTLALDAIDRQLIENAAAMSDQGFDDVWFDRAVWVSQITRNDPVVLENFLEAHAQGLTASAALRLALQAKDADTTNSRVARLRVLYPTTAWGDPAPTAEATALGLPASVAKDLAVELGVLQTVQYGRFITSDGRSVTEPPLTQDQLQLVAGFAEHADWFYKATGASNGERALRAFVAMTPAERQDKFGPIPAGFTDIARQLDNPDNDDIWEMMAGAQFNDRFLGPNGTYRPSGAAFATYGSPQALLTQLALLDAISPAFDDIDTDKNNRGVLTEAEVDAWLEANKNNPAVPPALVDKIRTGRQHGLGQDTLGWEEIGEAIGYTALAVGIAWSIAATGGAATPAWLKAGFLAAAGAEAYAYHQADENGQVVMAALGGLGELSSVAKLLRLTDEASDAITHADLATLARNTDIPGLKELADQADNLPPHVLTERVGDLTNSHLNRLGQDAIAKTGDPAQVAAGIHRTLFAKRTDYIDVAPPNPADHLGNDALVKSTRLELEVGQLWTNVGSAPVWVGNQRKYRDDDPLTWIFDSDGRLPADPAKNPDYLIDGHFRDVFSPVSSIPENALESALRKSKDGQTQRIDVNLNRSDVTIPEFIEALDSLVITAAQGDAELFARVVGHRQRATGTVVPLIELTVFKDNVWVQVWPRP